MELQTEVAGIRLKHPLMNAAGTCKVLEDVKKLSRSATAAIMVGSITVEPRMGNAGNVYRVWPGYSLNSLGLPNPGQCYYKKVLPEMVDLAHGEGKPLFVSVAGFSPQEYADLTETALEGGTDLIELNLGCPNVWQQGSGQKQKRIACFDSALTAEIFQLVGKMAGEVPVAVKISPFSDPFALAVVAYLIQAFKAVKVVTAVNTFPNAFAFGSDGEPAITPDGGLAGLGGPAMKLIGLGQVRQLRILLPERVQIIGCGGITTGTDVLEYRKCGAVAVQVATAYLERGEKFFSSLLVELIDTDDV